MKRGKWKEMEFWHLPSLLFFHSWPSEIRQVRNCEFFVFLQMRGRVGRAEKMRGNWWEGKGRNERWRRRNREENKMS